MLAVKVAGGIAAGVLVLLLLVIGALAFGGAPVVRWALEHPVSGFVGRQIAIDGPLTIAWGSPTRLTAEDVHVANAAWGTQPDMVVARRVEVQFFPWTLLGGPGHVPLIAFDHALLLLETSRDGKRNWDFARQFSSANPRRQFPNLDKLLVRAGTFRFHNGATSAETEIIADTLDIDAPDPTGPVKLAADGRFQGQPMRLAGTVGPLAELRNPAKPYPVDLEGRLGESSLVVQGTAAKPLAFDGIDARLSFAGRKLGELAAGLGLPLPPLPDFRATGELTGGNGAWTLKALTMALGHSDIEGGIAVNTEGKLPYLRADLTSGYLDMADVIGFLGEKPPTSSAPPPAAERENPGHRIISATPLAFRRLPGINADVSFDATHIAARKGLPLDRVSAGLQLKDGLITVKPLKFAVAGGQVAFDMAIDTTARPPALSLNLDIRRIDLAKLVGGTALPAPFKETKGITGGFAHVRGHGTSLRDFLGRMNGDAGLFAENGQFSQLVQEIADLNVVQALGLLTSGDRPVPINCLASRFDLRDGVATASTLLLDTTDTVVVGKGNFNFAAETIYVDLTPYHKHFAPLTLRTPIELRGTYANPIIRLSEAGIAERLGTALALGVLAPPAALLPLVDLGLGEDNACSRAFQAQKPEEPATGSSQEPPATPTGHR